MIIPPQTALLKSITYRTLSSSLEKIPKTVAKLIHPDASIDAGIWYINEDKKIGKGIINAFDTKAGDQAVGLLKHNLLLFRYNRAGGRFFEVDPKLNELIELTDLSDSCPNSILRLPFPDVYFHFPESTSIEIINSQGDKVNVCGIYAREIALLPGNPEYNDTQDRYGETNRGIEYACYLSELRNGVPTALKWTMSFGTHWIPARFEDSSIVSTSEQKEKLYRKHMGDEYTGKPDHIKTGDAVLIHLAKCIIFMSTPDALIEYQNDADALEKRIKRSGIKKMGKKTKKLSKTFNRIVIRYKPDDEDDEARPQASEDKRNVRKHFRRGHFKRVHYGKGHSQIKTVLIKPVLVNKDKHSKLIHTDYLLKE